MKAMAKKLLFYCFSCSLTVMVVLMLTGCATLFEPERDPASSYDRGYTPNGTATEDDKANEDDSDCVGRFCVPKNTNSKKDEESKNYFMPNEKNVRVKQAIDSRDVILGMTRNQVVESWG